MRLLSFLVYYKVGHESFPVVLVKLIIALLSRYRIHYSFIMHSYKVVSLLASAVVAQNTATVLNFFQLDTSLTVVGSDATATTFQHSCPSDAAGISAVPSDLRM